MKSTRKYPALGILFKGEMVRAIQAGRKTQTRRIMNPQPLRTERRWVREAEVGTLHVTQDLFGEGLVFALRESMTTTRNLGAVNFAEEFAPIKVDEILYVKETWCDGYPGTADPYLYRATYAGGADHKWKSSLFMPYTAARIFLKVTDVRVERLNDLSEADAIAEGVASTRVTTACSGSNVQYRYQNYSNRHDIHHPMHRWSMTAKHSYETLWDSINGKGAWTTNPYVWVYEFQITDKPAQA